MNTSHNKQITFYLTLMFAVFAMSSVHGQTAWSSVEGLPEKFQPDYDTSVEIELVDGGFVLASMSAENYNSSGPTLNVAELSLANSEHAITSFRFDSQGYYSGQESSLEDFIVTSSRDIKFVGFERWGNGSFLGTATLPVDPAYNRIGTDVTEVVRSYINSNSLYLYVNRSNLNVGYASYERTLWVTYRTASGEYEAEASDNTQLQIPDANHTRVGNTVSAGGLEIVSAFYGVDRNSYTVDYLSNQLDSPYYIRDLSANHIAQGGGVYLMALGVPSEENYYYNESPNALYYSTDLDAWSEVEIPAGVQITSLTYENDQFAATGTLSNYYNNYGYDDRVGVVMFSENGADWNINLINSVDEVSSIIWDSTAWIAGASDGYVLRKNGNVWDAYPLQDVYDDVTSIALANGYLVAGTEAGELYSTQDMVNWNLQASLGGPIDTVLANDSHFVCLSANGLSYSPFSPAGIADIVQQPASEYLTPGEQVGLTVAAVGDATLTYQWYEGSSGDVSNPITGADTTSLVTPQLYETTRYWVRVSNGVGSEDSATATLTMQEQPVITDQPENIEIVIAQYKSIRVSATGNNLSYQWFYGVSGDTSQPLAGGTGSSLSLRGIGEGVFYYWVRAYNEIGYADSSTAMTTVVGAPPEIRTEPVDVSGFVGGNTVLSISVAGPSLAYQWYAGLSGDTSTPMRSSSSALWTSQEVAGSYEYWVQISNAYGTVDSRTVKHTVLAQLAPVVTRYPLDLNTYAGQPGSLSIQVSGDDLVYRWYAGQSGDTSFLLNTTSSSLQISTTFPGAYSYWVRVSNQGGSVDSPTVSVAVSSNEQGVIAQQPQDKTTYRSISSSSNTLHVTTSTEAISYQWYLGITGDTSNPVDGATSDSVSPNISTAGDFSYWVRVTTSTDTIDSRAAAVSVLPRLLRITTQPVDKSTLLNTSGGISVRAYGDSLSYQWYQGESGDLTNPIENAARSYYSPPYIAVGEFTYWVRVTGGLESVDSRTVNFSVLNSLPYISTHPVDKEIIQGSSSSLYVSVYRSSGVTYHWYQGNAGDLSNPIDNSISSSLSLPSADLGIGVHRYWVRVSNSVGYVDSEVGEITVHPSGFEQWGAAYGLTLLMNAGGESTSGDQIPDLLKYAMGLDPRIYYEGTVLQYDTSGTGAGNYFTVQFSLQRELNDVDVWVEESTDLVTWEPSTVNVGPTLDNGDGTSAYTYRTSQPMNAGAGFIRLRVKSKP